MELGGYFGVVRRWWLVLLASILVAGAGGYVVASQLPKVYEAEAQILVGPLNTDFETQRAAGQLANTYAQLATSRRIADAVLARVGADRSPEDLQDAITAVPNDVTRLVILRVQDTDPERAAALANAVAEEIGVMAAESARPEGQTQIIDPAGASTIQVAPQSLLIVLLAAFAGLLAAISIVVLIEYARDAVRSEDELRAMTDVPVLGQLTTRLDRSRDFASAVLASQSADEYLAMTARIEQSLGSRKPRSVLVVGVEPGAQTSIAAMGIALAFGDRGVPAAFVDGSSHGAATEALGVASDPALVAGEWISTGEIPVTSVDFQIDAKTAQERRSVSLSVVPGAIGSDVVRTDRLQAILDAALNKAQVAIVTTAPPDRSPEALIWAGMIDAIVLVVPMPGTRRGHVRTAIQALQVARKRFIGTILTDPPLSGRYRFRRPLESRQSGIGAPPAKPSSPSIRLRPAPRERTPRVEP